MAEDPKAGTLDVLRGRRANRRLALWRAAFCAVLAIFALGRLIEGLLFGRFEKLRFLGPANYAESPFGYFVMGAVWLIAVAVCAGTAYLFWSQRND